VEFPGLKNPNSKFSSTDIKVSPSLIDWPLVSVLVAAWQEGARNNKEKKKTITGLLLMVIIPCNL
jgi:hypothetical protein